MDAPDAMDGLEVTACERCPELCESRSRIVNGVGDPDAALLFVGEAPGEQEDRQGEPFVGRSGDVLTDALRDRGLAREDVRITNCVRCRPPENRDPHVEELENCRPYLEAEIDRVDPELIVTLGKVPGEHLLDRPVAVTKEAGTVHDVRIADAPRRLLVCVHPAATLYDPNQKATLGSALDEAVSLAGGSGGSGGGSTGGQSRLGEF
jgi:DNA polymerase